MRFQYSNNYIPEGRPCTWQIPFQGNLHVHISAIYEITSDIERFVQSIISALPTAKDNLDSYHIAQRDDNNYMLKTYRIL